MVKYRNMVIFVAFIEFIAAGLIAGAGARAGDMGCIGKAGKLDQISGMSVAAPPYMVCSDTPSACSP